MSGTESLDEALARLEALLQRSEPLPILASLVLALDPVKQDEINVSEYAICLDSNVFLKLAGHSQRDDIVDYFLAKHRGPLIVSAQSLQEFWNSYLHAVETISAGLEKKFTEMEREVQKVEADLVNFRSRFDALLSEFSTEFGHLHDKNLRRNVGVLMDMIKKRAFIGEVPRDRFHRFAGCRQQLKTPPGFKDVGDGDYFVWVDFLFALMRKRSEGHVFEKAVLVTDDRKNDWSRGGVPHPTLTAEVAFLLGVPFETWPLSKLAIEVGKAPS